MIEREL